MKQFNFLLLFLFLLPISSYSQDVVLNEVISGNFKIVELRNLTNQEFDPANLFLILDGNTIAMNSVSSVCPFPTNNNLIIDPLGYEAYFISSISNEGGELALSFVENPTVADDLISYVIWGDGEATLQALAIEKGIWDNTEKAYAYGSPGSIEFDGGIGANSWLIQSDPSQCEENSLSCSPAAVNITFNDNNLCMCDDDVDSFSATFGGNTADVLLPVLISADNVIQFIGEIMSTGQFNQDICFEGALDYAILFYDSEIIGLEVGASIDDLAGCYSFSERYPLNISKLGDYDGVMMIDNQPIDLDSVLTICTMDDADEIFTISSTVAHDAVHFIIDEDNNIVDQFEGIDVAYDYTNLPTGEYTLKSSAFNGTVSNAIGNPAWQTTIEGCEFSTGDEWTFIIINNAACIVTSTNELDDLASANINFIQRNNILEFTTAALPNGLNQVKIYDMTGKNLQQVSLTSNSTTMITLNDFPNGIYILSVLNNNNTYSNLILKK